MLKMLLYHNLEDAEADLKVWWINSIKERASDGTLYCVRDRKKYNLSDLSDDDLCDSSRFPIFGIKNGAINKIDGFTTSWDDPQLILNGEYSGMYTILEPPEYKKRGLKPALVSQLGENWFDEEE